jgi:hypothetical protein
MPDAENHPDFYHYTCEAGFQRIVASNSLWSTFFEDLNDSVEIKECGVLISAVAYDLLEDGFQEGGIWPIAAGSMAGSFAYAIADWLVSRKGCQHRKRSGDQQRKDGEGAGLQSLSAPF